MRQGNRLELVKLAFRGLDRSRTGRVSMTEIKSGVKIADKKYNQEEFIARCERFFGKKKEVEFWEFYKMITDEDIDPKTCPYNGNKPTPKSSSCCLLF